jgi:hypothetical protein
MSTNVIPPAWFSAENMPLANRIERICDFGGSLPPRKPSTRIVPPGPAISFSTFSISSGSSGSASICSLLSTLLNRSLFGSDALVAGSRPTATFSSSFWIARGTSRLLSPARTRCSGITAVSKPEKLTSIA